jgi:hypothetical protein
VWICGGYACQEPIEWLQLGGYLFKDMNDIFDGPEWWPILCLFFWTTPRFGLEEVLLSMFSVQIFETDGGLLVGEDKDNLILEIV